MNSARDDGPMKTLCGLEREEKFNCGGRDDIPFEICKKCWARSPQSFYKAIRGPAKVDFVIDLDALEKDGKAKKSPVSGRADSFDCPRCGNLISPDVKDTYKEIGSREHQSWLIECKFCKARIKLLWKDVCDLQDYERVPLPARRREMITRTAFYRRA